MTFQPLGKRRRPKGKTPRKRRGSELADSGDEGELRGGNDDAGDDVDDKVE